MNGGNGWRWREWEPVPRIIIICQLYQGHSWLATLIDILHDPRRPCVTAYKITGGFINIIIIIARDKSSQFVWACNSLRAVCTLLGRWFLASICSSPRWTFHFIYASQCCWRIPQQIRPCNRNLWYTCDTNDMQKYQRGGFLNSHLRLIVGHWSPFEPYCDYANMYWLESIQGTIKNSIHMFPFLTKEPKAL